MEADAAILKALAFCTTVSVKQLDNGVFRCWGVGIGVNSGKVVYGEGSTVKKALLSLANACESDSRWRPDKFKRDAPF